MNKKGQGSVEIFVVISTVFILLLLVLVTVAQRNEITLQRSELNENQQLCDRISNMIFLFQANPGYSDANIILNLDVHVEKNNILIGGAVCYYQKSLFLENPIITYTADTEGFDLSKEIVYKMKTRNAGVVFCDASQDWC